MTKRKLSNDELAAIYAKSGGQKGVPSKAFLNKLNHGVQTPSLKVTNVKMFAQSSKPHSEVKFNDGDVVKVKEVHDPYKAASNARMFKRNK